MTEPQAQRVDRSSGRDAELLAALDRRANIVAAGVPGIDPLLADIAARWRGMAEREAELVAANNREVARRRAIQQELNRAKSDIAGA